MICPACRTMSKKRVTVTIDDDLDKKIRQMQDKMVNEQKKSFSYSKVIDMILRNALKKS